MKNRHGEPIAPEAAQAIGLLKSLRVKVGNIPATTQSNREAIADALDSLHVCELCLSDVEPETETEGRPDHAIII